MSSDSERSESDSPSLARNMKRCNKQLMEKKRRGRINSSLDDLKALVLQAANKDSAQYSKLEKADILEMTVKHLRTLQQQQLAMAAAADSSVLLKFRAGFHECAGEVSRYLGTIDGLSPEVRSRLLHHLSNCTTRVGAACEASSMMGGGHHFPTATPYASLPGSHPSGFTTLQSAGEVAARSQCFQQVAPQRYSGSFQVIPSAYMLPSQLHSAFLTGEQHNMRSDFTSDVRRRSDSISSSESTSGDDLDLAMRIEATPRPKPEPQPWPQQSEIKTEPVLPSSGQQKVDIPPHYVQPVVKQENMWRPW